MLIENAFTVAAPAEDLWAYVLDVERIAPCLPGAELTETLDDRHWKGIWRARFGPVAMAFAGTVAMESRDDVAHRVVLKARGMEEKGRGAADATVTAWLDPGDGLTTVRIQAEIVLTGAAAQLSRGLLPEISRKLTQRFADCLEAGMAAEARVPAPKAAVPVPETGMQTPAGAEPVGGLRLGLAAMWTIVKNFVRKLLRRPSGN